MKKEVFVFEGQNNEPMHTVVWLPEKEPEMILQVVHGMTEHMGRYEHFAKMMCNAGIGVAGFDLRGHGHHDRNAACASFKETGWDWTIKEIHQFHCVLKSRFSHVKHVLMGFSLGSFLVRDYLSVVSDHDFIGTIIMGTGQQPSWILSLIMKLVKNEIKKIGFDATNELIRSLSFGTYNKKFTPNRTSADWLCSDTVQLDAYLKDDLCKKDISAGLFLQLLDAMNRTGNQKTYQNWNKQLPVLLVSGSDDPVGDHGKGVLNVFKSMKKAGCTHVEYKLYPKARHDLLHEDCLNVTETVCSDIKDWMLGLAEK